MKWLSAYFQEVWGWRLGVQFVFLALLNSMASRINGFTVHSWGEEGVVQSKPTRRRPYSDGTKDSQHMSSMAANMELCRWLFVDEVEVVGAEILGTLEQNYF